MKKIKSIILSIICLALAVLSFSGMLNGITDKLNMVRSANDAYMEQSQEKAVFGFLVLSGVKTGLAIIEGSELSVGLFGNGASVQAGDSVQAMYDLTDWLWKTSFFGGVMLTAMRTLLHVSSLISPYALGACALLLALIAPAPDALRRKSSFRFLRNGLVLSVFLFLLCQFAIPVSIWSASKLSNLLTKQVSEEAMRNMQEFGAVFSMNEGEKMIDYTKRMLHNAPNIYQSCKDGLKKLVVSGMQFITAYLFDCILFPLGMFQLFKKLILVIIKYLFEPDGKDRPRPWLDWLMPPSPMDPLLAGGPGGLVPPPAAPEPMPMQPQGGNANADPVPDMNPFAGMGQEQNNSQDSNLQP